MWAQRAREQFLGGGSGEGKTGRSRGGGIWGGLQIPTETVEWEHNSSPFVAVSQKSGCVKRPQGMASGPFALGALALGAAWRQGGEEVRERQWELLEPQRVHSLVGEGGRAPRCRVGVVGA